MNRRAEDPGPRRVPLPQVKPPSSEPPRRNRFARRRAATLLGVHVLAAAHIAHWRISGKTLAPLEFNEVMHTLELGIVTAGFTLMALAVLSVGVFGRFFCSWGCHILALQDLSAWVLAKLRIRAKAVRSRVLLLVAPGAMLYMFVWPQVSRIAEGRAMPAFHLRDDAGGWASFVTDDFWRNLPDPLVALITFGVCGFAIVYVLGTRSFCLYACPYGVIFGIMDRLAPGRIKVDPDKCTSCGVCTGVCESHVRVHSEIALHGSVVDPACLKDLDCVSACPEQALSFGWTRPSLLRSLRPGRRNLPYDFTLFEDMLMAAVFLGSLAVFRGLYGAVPFLLTLAIGGILAYLSVLALRLPRNQNVRFNQFQLKLKGRITRAGVVFGVLAIGAGGFVGHSAFIRYHELMGQHALDRATTLYQRGDDADRVERLAREARRHLELCERWGLITAPGHHTRMASACWASGDIGAAESSWRFAYERFPENYDARLDLAASFMRRGRADLASSVLHEVTQAREHSTKDRARFAHYRGSAWMSLGAIAVAENDPASAAAAFEAASREQPRDGAPLLALGELRMMSADIEGAAECLRAVVDIDPHNSQVLVNLGLLEARLGSPQDAARLFRQAAELTRDNPAIWTDLGAMLRDLGERHEAEQFFEAALLADPDFVSAHRQLGRLLSEIGHGDEGAEHLHRAAALEGSLSPSNRESPVGAAPSGP